MINIFLNIFHSSYFNQRRSLTFKMSPFSIPLLKLCTSFFFRLNYLLPLVPGILWDVLVHTPLENTCSSLTTLPLFPAFDTERMAVQLFYFKPQYPDQLKTWFIVEFGLILMNYIMITIFLYVGFKIRAHINLRIMGIFLVLSYYPNLTARLVIIGFEMEIFPLKGKKVVCSTKEEFLFFRWSQR